jgi:hypothetical protein
MAHVEGPTNTNARAQNLATAAPVPGSVALRQLIVQLDARSSSEPVSHPTSPRMVRVQVPKNTNAKGLPSEIVAVARASVVVRRLTAQLDAKSSSEPVSHPTSPRMVRVQVPKNTNAKVLPLATVAVAQASVAVQLPTVGRAVK